jgi:3'-phosphoadenosine 5'-phosphosulfate sulfotransferase (PAPS reductase)/FAD synthetase
MIPLSELRDRQSMSLEFKIRYSTLKIREWFEHYNGNVVVSKSGLDSVVLLDLVRSVYPSVLSVYVDTGQENLTVVDHNKSIENCLIIRPKFSFHDVVTKAGYPVISKLVSRYLSDLQNPTPNNIKTRHLRLTGIKQDGSRGNSGSVLPKCYRYLVDCGYKFSNKCCDILKKQPLKSFQKTYGLFPFVGTLADDSQSREVSYLRSGCNSFDAVSPTSTPLSIWTRQDILAYASSKSLAYPSCYGDIKFAGEKLSLTGEQHTGCEGCLFGIRQDPQRIERIKQWSLPRYNYYMDRLDYKKLVPLLLSPPDQQLSLFGGVL